ncbi:MAG: cytochrome c [Chloroflexi bacterium]|nr:cytochrome c [Chloroflexota bacterium]MBI2983142.1 cytochrome c [Chloroflexota bacterium]
MSVVGRVLDASRARVADWADTATRAPAATVASLRAFRAAVVRRRRALLVAGSLLVAVWTVPALLPEEIGLGFGASYRLFFSAFVVAGFLLFELLGSPASVTSVAPRHVLLNVVLVYSVTVGGLVSLGQLYPQFEVPRLRPGQTDLTPEERGKAIFWDRSVGCFACHAIDGIGGRRAPDLSGIGTRAAARKPGVAAEEYIRGHIRQGSQYGPVAGYAPIMPPFEKRLAPELLDDLVLYLVSLQ